MEIGPATPAISQSLTRAAEENPEVAVSLLKKTLQSDKEAVAQFLPPQGLVDIRA